MNFFNTGNNQFAEEIIMQMSSSIDAYLTLNT